MLNREIQRKLQRETVDLKEAHTTAINMEMGEKKPDGINSAKIFNQHTKNV